MCVWVDASATAEVGRGGQGQGGRGRVGQAPGVRREQSQKLYQTEPLGVRARMRWLWTAAAATAAGVESETGVGVAGRRTVWGGLGEEWEVGPAGGVHTGGGGGGVEGEGVRAQEQRL